MTGIDERLNRKLLLEHDHKKKLYDDFLVLILRFLGEFVKENALGVYSYEGSVMSRESLQSSLEAGLQVSSIEEIDDFVSIQVLTFFEDDVQAVAHVLDSEFNMIKGAFDKKEIRDPERFGYQSQFYVMGMKDSRLEWIEYRCFAGCKVKVEVCSLMQHTWARIQDRLAIDKESIPLHQLRSTSRIVGLFELADRELNQLKNRLPLAQSDHTPPVTQTATRPDVAPPRAKDVVVEDAPAPEPIIDLAEVQDGPALVWTTDIFSKIILDDATIRRLDRAISDTFYTRLKFDVKFIDRLCEVANKFHISSEDTLLKFMNEHEKTILWHSEELIEKPGTSDAFIIPRGIAVLMLFYIIAKDAGDKGALNKIAAIVQNSFKSG